MSIDLKLFAVKINKIKLCGEGDSYCIDLSSNFKKGNSLLSGSFNRSLFLMGCKENQIYPGCTSSYVLCKNKDTKYLNEIKQGDELLTTDFKGNSLSNIVTKSELKITSMTSISGKYLISSKEVLELFDENGEDYFNIYRDILHLKGKNERSVHVLDFKKYINKKKEVHAYLDVGTIIPSIEDIFLKKSDGKSISLKQLKLGDNILAYIRPKLGSRHFGMAYEGHCIER